MNLIVVGVGSMTGMLHNSLQRLLYEVVQEAILGARQLENEDVDPSDQSQLLGDTGSHAMSRDSGDGAKAGGLVDRA